MAHKVDKSAIRAVSAKQLVNETLGQNSEFEDDLVSVVIIL